MKNATSPRHKARLTYEGPAPCVAAYPAPVCVPPMAPPPRVWHEGHYIYVPRSVWVDTSYAVEDWVPAYRCADGGWVRAHRVRRIIPSGYWATTQEKLWGAAGYE